MHDRTAEARTCTAAARRNTTAPAVPWAVAIGCSLSLSPSANPIQPSPAGGRSACAAPDALRSVGPPLGCFPPDYLSVHPVYFLFSLVFYFLVLILNMWVATIITIDKSLLHQIFFFHLFSFFFIFFLPSLFNMWIATIISYMANQIYMFEIFV